MLRLIAPVLFLTSLAGCATHETFQTEPQYCYTDEVIENNNGSVSSKTITSCTDKPKANHLTRDLGVTGMCKHYDRDFTRPNGERIRIQGVQCREKLTGKWISVDPNGLY